MVLEMMRIRWYSVTGKYGETISVPSAGILTEGQRPRT
jgi:hypothetical protein